MTTVVMFLCNTTKHKWTHNNKDSARVCVHLSLQQNLTFTSVTEADSSFIADSSGGGRSKVKGKKFFRKSY